MDRSLEEFEIQTKDPKVVVRSLAKSCCNRMHMISSLMETIRKYQKAPEFNIHHCSINSVDGLNKILDELIYMYSCEANCELMGLVEAVSNNPIEQIVINYSESEN